MPPDSGGAFYYFKYLSFIKKEYEKKQTVSFTINKRDLCSFDKQQSAWVAVGGDYKVYIGASSKDTQLNTSFTLQTGLIVKKVNNVLAPAQKITELK